MPQTHSPPLPRRCENSRVFPAIFRRVQPLAPALAFLTAVVGRLPATLVAILLVGLTACSGFRWPGTENTCRETHYSDTWEVECNCARIVAGEIQTTSGSLRACGLDHDGDGALAPLKLTSECRHLAVLLTGRTSLPVWTCEPRTHRFLSAHDCAQEVTVRCADTGSSREPLLAWRNPQATLIGTLDPARSYINLRVGDYVASPALTGEIFVTGGLCPDGNCDMTVDGLVVRTADFALNGADVRDVDFINVGVWPGVKLSDNTYTFDPNAEVKLAGTVAGDRGFGLGAPTVDVGGAFFDVPAPLPGGSVTRYRYMTIEGTFDFGGDTAEIFLVFPFGTGAPSPVITARWVDCRLWDPGDCGYVFDASRSRSYDGMPVAQYRWYDAHGNRVGTGPQIDESAIFEIPDEPSRWPLTVVVTDAEGRRASTTTGPYDEPARTGAHGWVWAHSPTSNSYTPSTWYQYNSAGGNNTIYRSGTGVYLVTFPGLGGAGGNIQVTSYGWDANHCGVGYWYTTGADLRTQVRCYTAAGATADSRFVAHYHREGFAESGAVFHTPATAYLWAHSPTSSRYSPSTYYAWNDTGSGTTIRRLGTGHYEVTVPGHPLTGSHAQVTAYGATPDTCKVTGWYGVGNDAVVAVGCFTLSGVARDNRFTFSLSSNATPSFESSLAARRRGAHAWVLVNDDNAVRTPKAYQYNALVAAASTRTITTTRYGVGSYGVSIPRAIAVGAADTVQVTAMGADSAACKVRYWGRYSTSTAVRVSCMDASGAPVDSGFLITYVTAAAP